MNQDMNIVFIDIEWEQFGNWATENDRIVEIGATKLGKKSKFIGYVKHDKAISRRTRRLLSLKNSQIEASKPIEEIMKSLQLYVKDAVAVVVWSDSTKMKLISLAKKYKCRNLIKNIIVFQNWMTEIIGASDEIGFDSALISMKVEYNPKFMHNASYDARQLNNLFTKVCSKYEDINPILKEKLVCAGSYPKTYHVSGCSCLRKENEKTLKYELITGLKPCKRCVGELSPLVLNIGASDKVKKIKRVKSYKSKPVDEVKMHEIADFFGLRVSGGLDFITLFTGYSYWQVYCGKNGYVDRLKHENYNTRDKKGNGYHEHKEFPKDVFSLFEYIYLHDENSNIKPIVEDLERKQKKKEKKKKMQKERKHFEYDEWEKYYDMK